MTEVTYRFTLPEDQSELNIFDAAPKLHSALLGLDRELRNILHYDGTKFEGKSVETIQDLAQGISTFIWEALSGAGLE